MKKPINPCRQQHFQLSYTEAILQASQLVQLTNKQQIATTNYYKFNNQSTGQSTKQPSFNTSSQSCSPGRRHHTFNRKIILTPTNYSLFVCMGVYTRKKVGYNS